MMNAAPGYRKTLEMGRISNLITSDLNQIILALNLSFLLVISPILILLYSIILVKRIGWLGLCMPLYILLVYFQNRWMTTEVLLNRQQRDALRNERAKLINECVVGIKMVKFGGWEHIYQENIDRIRK